MISAAYAVINCNCLRTWAHVSMAVRTHVSRCTWAHVSMAVCTHVSTCTCSRIHTFSGACTLCPHFFTRPFSLKQADNKEEQVQQLMHRLDEVVNSKPPMYSLLLVLVLVSMVGLTNFIWSRGVFGDVWLLFKRHLWSWIDWFGDQTPKENTEL